MRLQPAYYAKGPTGWRAWWTLLHPPYTLMHLSFVAAGAAIAPNLDMARLGLTLLAFLLGMGLAAHALDELNGRPLGTTISTPVLVAVAAVALAGAAAIGVWAALRWDLLPILGLVALGVLLVLAYNLEFWGGRFHTDLAFAGAWGAFPAIVAYYAQTGTITPAALAVAAYALLISLAQRHLSTPARALRRRTQSVDGRIIYADGRIETITRESLLKTPERALKALVWTSLAVAAALLLGHLPPMV